MVPVRVIPVEYVETEELCWIPDVVNSDPLELDDDPSGLQQDYERSE